MTVFQSASENLKASSRRIVICGAPGSGKTTLSVSASKHAGETIGGSQVECSDVAVISGDAEGIAGAMDAGLTPGLVVDMTVCENWEAYKKLLTSAIGELRPLVKDGKIKYIVVDLSLPAKLIIDHVAPADVAGWGRVGKEGLVLYKCFGVLHGATLIANCQIKSAQGAVENAVAVAAAEAKAVGGERSTFTLDLPKSIAAPWVENASLMLSREVKRTKTTPVTRQFFTHTSASSRFETKSRFNTKLKPTEPGDRTLNSILVAAYGENL